MTDNSNLKEYLDDVLSKGIGRGTYYRLGEPLTSEEGQETNEVKAKVKAKEVTGRNKDVVIEEIKLYCTVWRKSVEMARHVGKTPQYLSRVIIPEMMRLGILIREYPDVATHPAQRYRVNPKNLK